MNPEIRADDNGFLDSPRSALVTARFGGAGAAQPRHAYQIHVYRATDGLMPAAARRSFAPRMWSLTGIAAFGGQRSGRSGRLLILAGASSPGLAGALFTQSQVGPVC